MNCRHCSLPLKHTFLDLGFAPPSNAYLKLEDLTKPELYYPLKLKVCENCYLVQTEDYTEYDKLFSDDYAYFSSTSSSWLTHAKKFSNEIAKSLKLDAASFVLEIASNDGYLLKNFVEAGIPCLGVEPTKSTADAAEKSGIPVLRSFFNENLALKLKEEGRIADLVIGNNVFAHVPEINDFARGLKVILKPGGTITLEFPHLLRLIEDCQFDTVYHEHFSYLSLFTVKRIFEKAGLRIFDVTELSTHGGSLRIFGCHNDDQRLVSSKVAEILVKEGNSGLRHLAIYEEFQARADWVKNDLLHFLLKTKAEGKTVIAYGAAAKGNTLLNYAGVKPDLLPIVCDAAFSKQGKYLPGSHIPILSPEVLKHKQPDYLLILPWNLANEIREQNMCLSNASCQYVTAVPKLKIV